MTDIIQRAKLTLKAENTPVGQPPVKEIPVTGPARVESDLIETATDLPKAEKAAMLRFMEEPVTIMIHPSSDQTDPSQFVQVGNDGVQKVLPRGQQITVERKFVDALMRGRNERQDQQVGRDQNGEPYNRLYPRAALKYPFDVIEDSAQGRDWIRHKMSEAI